MYTHSYKGGYIHGHCDGSKYTYQLPNDYAVYKAKSYRSAQIAITKSVKETRA